MHVAKPCMSSTCIASFSCGFSAVLVFGLLSLASLLPFLLVGAFLGLLKTTTSSSNCSSCMCCLAVALLVRVLMLLRTATDMNTQLSCAEGRPLRGRPSSASSPQNGWPKNLPQANELQDDPKTTQDSPKDGSR